MIDIGLNLTNRQFVHDQEELLYRAEEAGVTQMILTGTSLRSSKESFALAKGYPTLLYSTAGVHPHDAKTMNEQTIPQLSTLLKEKQVVAVGECGLDFDRDFSPRPVQEQCFHAQLALAQEVQKPLFLHERAAFDRFVGILKEYNHLPKGVVHCF
ncbi:MAG: TatD family hydrolase, partial [Capnocytophaga granulosa]